MKRIPGFSLVLLASLTAGVMAHAEGTPESIFTSWWKRFQVGVFFPPAVIAPAEKAPEVILHEALDSANAQRAQAGMDALRFHPELQLVLEPFVRTLGLTNADLPRIFDRIETEIPRIHEVSAHLLFAGSSTEVLERLGGWTDLTDARHTHYALWMFSPEGRRGAGCLAVLARELPSLKLPLHQAAADAFYAQCDRCGDGHGLSLERAQRGTLIIRCPHCEEPYNLMATDSDGTWYRANQFLRPPSPGPRRAVESLKLKEVMDLWGKVVAKCRYQLDAQRISGADSWKLPEETMRTGSGDCEDTSILMATLLRERGYDVRVALGTHEGEGHAWCVLRLNGEEYLLETTGSRVERRKRPPTVAEEGVAYEADYLFDEENLYFKRIDGWTSNCWSPEVWVRVQGASRPMMVAR